MARAPRKLSVWDMASVVAKLPAALPLNDTTVGHADLFIGVLGFEDRCLAVPQKLADAGWSADRVALCEYATNVPDNQRNREALEAACRGYGGTLEWLPVSQAEFSHGIRTVMQLTAARDALPRVVFDISVASNDIIAQVVRVLLEYNIDLTILYAEADEYYPTEDEFKSERERFTTEEHMGLGRGVLNVQTAAEFPGQHSHQLPHAVVVFPGFSRDRVRAAVSKIDSEFIVDLENAPLVWMIGRPDREANRWRQRALQEIHDVLPLHEQHAVSTFDYRETISAMEQIYAGRGIDYNITVAPLGSKMQALGLAIFCFARQDVRVVSSQPREYNAKHYSRGARALWAVPLGSLVSLRHDLLRVDELELVQP